MKNILTLLCVFFLAFQLSAQSNLNWTTLNTGTTKNINDIYFHSPDVGYLVGDNYLFKKTTDGGLTWTDLTPPSIGEKPNNNGNIIGIGHHGSFSFSQLDSGLYLTWENGYHGVSTSDEGASYTIFPYLDSNQFCNINGFSVLPANRGNGYINLYTFGQNCYGDAVLTNYYDGPFSLNLSDTSISFQSGSFTTVDADSFASIFGHSNGYLMRYTYVLTAPDSIFLDSSGVSAISYAGNHVWYAATNRLFYNLYVSADDGKTFHLDSTLAPTFFYPRFTSLSFLSPQIGLAGASSNGRGAIVVKDSLLWNYHIAPQQINKVKLFSNGVAYVAGDSGLIMKTVLITSIGKVRTNQQSLLFYPNPTSNTIRIKGLENKTVDAIQLYDMQGKLLQRFPNKTRELTLKGYDKGIYIVRVLSEGQSFTQKVRLE